MRARLKRSAAATTVSHGSTTVWKRVPSAVPPHGVLWKRVRGPRVLEIGVGTGKNMAYYPPGVQVSAIDLSPRMLEQARRRAVRQAVPVNLCEADVQALPFPDAYFDTAVATFVFCSVPDPVLGLCEVRRVLQPGGQLLLLEHVLPRHPILRRLMRLVNPIVVRLMGANIDRDTVANVRQAGFVSVQVEDLWLDIVKLIEARAPGRTELVPAAYAAPEEDR